MPAKRLSITIHDVAAEAGVSARTVSRVINQSPKVGAATRETIQRAIDRLGFHPSSRARGLSVGRSFLIGVVQDDPNAHVIGVLQHGIVETASRRGYELVVHAASIGDPVLAADVAAFIERSRVDGLILLPPVSERQDVAAAIEDLGVPVVGIAAVKIPGYAFALVSDERAAAAEMGRHLAGLGHRRIGFVTGPHGLHSSMEREAGFRAALDEAGIALAPECVIAGDYSFAAGIAAGEALLALAEPPTAIFASNDIMAAGLLKVAQARDVAVPGALSLAGFDDSDIAVMLTPELTTLRRPFRESAARATGALLDLIEGRPPAEEPDDRVRLTLIVRGSTGPVRADVRACKPPVQAALASAGGVPAPSRR